MPVYVGPLKQILPNGHSKYSYAAELWADSLVELLMFAQRIGLKRCWLIETPRPHFDLTPGLFRKALRHGALTKRKPGRPANGAPLWEGLE